jgi:hypothetical protein
MSSDMNERPDGDVECEACRRIVYWSVGEQERLAHETMDDAIRDYLETWLLPGGDWANNLPNEIEVVGYARMQPTFRRLDTLEYTLEYLDEEYGDPDGGHTVPTPAMMVAEAAYHAAVLGEYESWMCEPVLRRTVDVREWIAANEKTGLEEPCPECGEKD